MKIGNTVKIKYGTLDPDFEKYDMSGWQGRIIEIDQIDGLNFEIELDSFTLKQIPRRYILDSLKDGTDYAIIYVNSFDVVKTEPRDTEEEVRNVRLALNKDLNYVSSLDVDEEKSQQELVVVNILLHVKNKKLTQDELKDICLN